MRNDQNVNQIVLFLVGAALITLAVFIIARIKNPQDDYRLPHTIWVYWDSHDPPDFIKQNLERWRTTLSAWDIRYFNRDDIAPILPEQVSALSVQHQSDWLRLYLLKLHGGVWIDAGIIMNSQKALDELYDESIATRSEWTGFKLGEMLENWFIMAPKDSPIIKHWFDEYEKAVRLGFHKYRKEIEQEGIDTHDIYRNVKDVYLTQHACLRAVLTRHYPEKKPSMIVKDATESMFKIHVECDWKRKCILERLSHDDAKKIPFIKMRGADRPV